MAGTRDQNPLLLTIDDSPMIHRLLATKLKTQGLEFLTALGGSEGVDMAREHKPSLILCDLCMPDLNGFEVIRQLKSNPETMRIPVVVLSGDEAPEHKVRAFKLGAMDFVTKPFDASELRARIHSALQITNLMRLLEQRAQVDGLTGLWNRARFDTALAEELNQSARRSDHLTLVIADLDHFKKLNDTFGHQAGDAAIVAFAKILESEMRSYDLACRYGGEEFTLILPHSEKDDGLKVTERIRKQIENHRWPAYPEMKTTASFGLVSALAKENMAIDQWVERADAALYSAKQNGRNRVVVWNEAIELANQPVPEAKAG